jgi:hypothetical protein
MWRDPLDELIEAVEEIAPAPYPDGWLRYGLPPLEDVQLYVATILFNHQASPHDQRRIDRLLAYWADKNRTAESPTK